MISVNVQKEKDTTYSDLMAYCFFVFTDEEEKVLFKLPKGLGYLDPSDSSIVSETKYETDRPVKQIDILRVEYKYFV